MTVVDADQPAATPAGRMPRRRDAPAFPDGHVRRPALVGCLARAREASLALLAAPAGYGKSTLLAEWAEHDERPFIWVSPPRRDEAPDALAASIVQAFDDAGYLEPETASAHRASLEGDPLATLAELMGEVGGPGRSFVLVLDDGHLLSAPVLGRVLSTLLEQLAPGSQIALGSREEPALPLARLRARRALVEVRRRI